LIHGTPGDHCTVVVGMAEKKDFSTCSPAAQLSPVASKSKVEFPSAMPGAEQASVITVAVPWLADAGAEAALATDAELAALAPEPGGESECG
jgi:hypothetical protein